MQFLDHFEKNLLYTVACFFFVFEVLHAYTQQQEGISLQQNAEPFIIMVGMKALQKLLVADMAVFVLIHPVKAAISLLDAVIG